MKTKHTVGFIGLGLMGGAIAEQYLRAGGTPIVFDLSETLVDKLGAQGAQRALSPRDIGDKASVVIACLPSPAISRKVALGEDGVCFGRKIGIYIEASTIGVTACRDIARGMSEKNIRMVDAPVSGGPRAAAQGTLTSMIAAQPETWRETEEIVGAYSGRKFLVGAEPGLAQAFKLVKKHMSLATLALACATAVFGVALGLDAHTDRKSVGRGKDGS